MLDDIAEDIITEAAGARALSLGASPLPGRARPLVSFAVQLAALAGTYYGAAHLGYAFSFSGPVAAIVWLPVGVAIVGLSLGGLRLWPAVVAGDLLVNNYSALPVGAAIGQTAGNLLEVLVATVIIRRLRARGPPLESIDGLTGLFAAIALGTALSATIGTLSLWLGDVVAISSAATVWRTWWLGDVCGAIIVVPLGLAWLSRRPGAVSRVRWAEAVALGAVVTVVSEGALHTSHPLSYLAFPALIWAALRFGPRGATLAITVVTGFTIWGTTHFVGPFVYDSSTRSVLETQLFIAIAAGSTLALAALVSERTRMARHLRASRVRLVEAADAERRRLERNLHDGAQQRLVALTNRLAAAGAEVHDAPDAAQRTIGAARDELQLAIDELRELAHGLHPPVLRDLGLRGAIQTLVMRTTVPIEVLAVPHERLDDTTEATAYYIVLEAVANAERQGAAVALELRVDPRCGRLRIVVSDDGGGGAVERSGSGLQGLRDRVEAVGGSFDLDSPVGAGTRLKADIPIGISPSG